MHVVNSKTGATLSLDQKLMRQNTARFHVSKDGRAVEDKQLVGLLLSSCTVFPEDVVPTIQTCENGKRLLEAAQKFSGLCRFAIVRT
jgi:hypothetical protein